MKKIIVASVPLILGVILMIASLFAPSGVVLKNGVLYEPYFFLVPLSVLFIFIGVIVLMIIAIITIKKNIKKR